MSPSRRALLITSNNQVKDGVNMITSPYEKYRQSSVQTATPEHLVVMLYDGAIRFIRTAIQGIDA